MATDASNLLQQAINAYKTENYEMAIVYLDDAIVQDPDIPEVYFWRGKVAVKDLNDEVVETAIADFTQAIDLKPDFWEAYFERGKVYLYFDRLEEAEADFKKVVELNPDFKDVYSYLAQIEIQRGNDTKAMEYLNSVTEGGDYKYYYNLGKIFLNAKSYEAAIENLSKALSENKYLVDGYYLRAKAYEALEMYR
ncbi:tetratricopeptide repeat protein, partial [Persephonella sp.]